MAGTVVRVGSNVRRFKLGDEVYARPRDGRVGTFAELINEADVVLKPKNLSMEDVASIPLVGLTAWQVLVEAANLEKGQKVLIHAGSGGVGTPVRCAHRPRARHTYGTSVSAFHRLNTFVPSAITKAITMPDGPPTRAPSATKIAVSAASSIAVFM